MKDLDKIERISIKGDEIFILYKEEYVGKIPRRVDTPDCAENNNICVFCGEHSDIEMTVCFFCGRIFSSDDIRQETQKKEEKK